MLFLQRGSNFNEGFSNVDTLSPVRMAIFLNWIIGEQRPAQAALFYLLSATYSLGPSDLARWAYELHSTFLVPGAVSLRFQIVIIVLTQKEKITNLSNFFLF